MSELSRTQALQMQINLRRRAGLDLLRRVHELRDQARVLRVVKLLTDVDSFLNTPMPGETERARLDAAERYYAHCDLALRALEKEFAKAESDW